MIDIYFAGSSSKESEEYIEKNQCCRLFSYLNDKSNLKKRFEKGIKDKLLVDSGAFTAWTKGALIDVDGYINWLNQNDEYIYLCGQIDSIPGEINRKATYEEVRVAAGKTWQNYLYMRSKMKSPNKLLYTFHVGEPKEFLKQALEWKDEDGECIPYIAFGGMVGKNAEVRRNFLTMCFDIIKKSSNPNVKVHAFGMTSQDLLSEFPITSCDSTSWIMTAATGGIMTDVGTVTVSMNQSNLTTHFSHLPVDLRQEFENEVKEFGFTLEQLANDTKNRLIYNIKYMKNRISKIKYKSNGKKSLF